MIIVLNEESHTMNYKEMASAINFVQCNVMFRQSVIKIILYLASPGEPISGLSHTDVEAEFPVKKII